MGESKETNRRPKMANWDFFYDTILASLSPHPPSGEREREREREE